MSAPAWAALAAAGATAAGGSYLVAVADHAVGGVVAGEGPQWRRAVARPLRSAALRLVQSRTTTERPDGPAWALAPGLYLALGLAALAVVPVSAGLVAVEVPGGLVAFGAAQALVVIPVFLNGWSANSLLALVGGFRFIAQALSYEMPNLLALLSVSVPASSLSLREIVVSQHHLWNVVRIPFGLPLLLFAAAGLAFWGPANLPDGADLAGGTQSETSGTPLLVWQLARAAMLVATAAMGAAAFLGGWLGPVLPGWLWMASKTGVLLVLLVATRHVAARVRPERYVVVSWAVLIPVALVNVLIAAAVAL